MSELKDHLNHLRTAEPPAESTLRVERVVMSTVLSRQTSTATSVWNLLPVSLVVLSAFILFQVVSLQNAKPIKVTSSPVRYLESTVISGNHVAMLFLETTPTNSEQTSKFFTIPATVSGGTR